MTTDAHDPDATSTGASTGATADDTDGGLVTPGSGPAEVAAAERDAARAGTGSSSPGAGAAPDQATGSSSPGAGQAPPPPEGSSDPGPGQAPPTREGSSDPGPAVTG